jgi:hypothetical protein
VTIKEFVRKHKPSIALMFTVLILTLSLFAAPAFSASTNQCSSCHPGYSQQLDLLEGNPQNNFPSSIQVGQTATVTVAIENNNNVPRYSQLSGVTVTLRSQNNHFTVNSQTYNVGTLGTGTATATWQITGTSAGTDQLVITASGTNPHENIGLIDSYSSSPQITITAGDNPPPASTPTPTPPAQPTPTPTGTQTPGQATQSPTNRPTSKPTIPQQTNNPLTTPMETPKPTAIPKETQKPTDEPTETDELDSAFLYIHPPLAIASYIFIFIFAALAFKGELITKKPGKLLGLATWILILAGLLTGMIWAQTTWGSYWTWEPKEVLTLTLLVTFTAGNVALFESKWKTARVLLVICCLLSVATAASSLVFAGVHSFV